MSTPDKVAADLAALGITAGARSVAITRYHGQLLLAGVKRRASLPRTGPPGPRIITGNYNRSLNVVHGLRGGSPTATVGTNAPQGRRLELGFTGTDSLGRSYAAPPYPHFGPALDAVAPLFVAAIAALADPGWTAPVAAPLTYTTKAGRTREATQAQIDNWTRRQR